MSLLPPKDDCLIIIGLVEEMDGLGCGDKWLMLSGFDSLDGDGLSLGISFLTYWGVTLGTTSFNWMVLSISFFCTYCLSLPKLNDPYELRDKIVH